MKPDLPDLTVHSYNEKDAGSPASISELTSWLTATATLQVPELEEKVKQFHYVECSDHQRLGLLDWIRPLLNNTAYAVRAAFADGKLPLPVHVINHIDGLGRINAIMADLYKNTIISLAARVLQNPEMSHKDRKSLHEDLILACYGAINFLSEQLRTCYESYRPVPEGVWHEIHQVYNYSHYIIDLSGNSPIDEEKIRDEFFLIEHIYKRSLLLGLCNPFDFQVDAFGELNRMLNKWAHLSKLEHNVDAPEQTCMFSIDENSDYPAAPILSHNGDLVTAGDLSVLSTKELVAALNEEINIVAKKAFEDSQKNAPGKLLLRIEMLRRLVINWGKHPIRQDVRHEKDGKCESVAGYNEIMKNMSSMLTAAIKKSPLNDKNCCMITDVSEMGYQLEMGSDCATRFRIGDMIAVRDQSNLDKWSLAVVRWARYSASKTIKLGMFVMGWQVERRRLKVAPSSDVTIVVMSILGESNFQSKKKILLVPASIYRPGKVMELIGEENQRIKAKNLIMSGADFDVIDYKLLS
jgi:hypothetical protein